MRRCQKAAELAVQLHAVPERGICEDAWADGTAPGFLQLGLLGDKQIHGTLIREGTCGNSDKCDYCVVGSENPMAKEYEIVRDEAGFLVSRKKSE